MKIFFFVSAKPSSMYKGCYPKKGYLQEHKGNRKNFSDHCSRRG